MLERGSGELLTSGAEMPVEAKTEKKFGRNIKAVIEFTRHEEPGKLPSGMSADFLTEKGKERAAAKGKEIKEPAVKGYASPKLRAQETGDLGLQNVSETVRVINQRLEELNVRRLNGEKESFKSRKGREQKPENTFLMRVRPELDVTKNFAAMMAEAKPWAGQQRANGSTRSEYDLVVQYYLDHPERAEALGVTKPEEAAQELAYAANHELDMTARFKNDSEVRLRNISHGPKLEPLLQQVMVQKDGQRGFRSLDEIGGSVPPGEGFEILSARDKQGELSATIRFRNKDFQIDLKRLQELAEAHKKRLEAEKQK